MYLRAMEFEEFGGDGTPVVLLHGLSGYPGEWAESAAFLTPRHRVVAPELRGEDVEPWLEGLGLGPAAVVGQSLGGFAAFRLAAARPDLVSRVVVAEATPSEDPGVSATVRAWLEGWPVPFADRDAAVAFFGDHNRGRTWAAGLVERDGGLWPRFDIDTEVGMLAAFERSYWDEWDAIHCPILIVRAATGEGDDDFGKMVERQPTAQLVEIPDAGHDLHLDQPERWQAALGPFLSRG